MPPADVAFSDFNRAPFLVIWEVTRACALACVHCRADAIHRRDPRELTTEEGVIEIAVGILTLQAIAINRLADTDCPLWALRNRPVITEPVADGS
jgi:hypothetical protein